MNPYYPAICSFRQLHKCVAFNLAIAQDFEHQTWANDFTPMNRDNCSSSIRMPQEVMASLDF